MNGYENGPSRWRSRIVMCQSQMARLRQKIDADPESRKAALYRAKIADLEGCVLNYEAALFAADPESMRSLIH